MHERTSIKLKFAIIYEFQKCKNLNKNNNIFIIQNEINLLLIIVNIIKIINVNHISTKIDIIVIFETQYNFSTKYQITKKIVRIEQIKKTNIYRFTCA